MLSRTLGITALAAAGAVNGVLIPPSISAADLDLGDDMAMEIVASSYPRTVALECPTCDFATKTGEGYIWSQSAGNSFMLDFEVGAREDTLNIDGVQLYPPTFGYFAEPFHVAQVDPAGNNLRLRVTGYTFHYNSAETVTEAGIELVPMTFRITSVEGKAVDPPALTINLLKDTNGRLMIASFQPATPAGKGLAEEKKECNEWPLMCKWRAILADRIEGVKSSVRQGCHRHKSNPMAHEGPEGKPPHQFRPGHPHHRPHHMGHHHHRFHRLHMTLRRGFFTVLVPILVGIFAGTLTYLIGMALGCLIAVVLAKVRGQPAYESVEQDEEEVYVDEPSEKTEKEVYAELPEYDAPPVYEEAAEKEVVEGPQ